jgi:hypothetical protein
MMAIAKSKTIKVKKQKTIQLVKVKHTAGGLSDFGKQLISNLGDDIFNCRTKTDLLYRILLQVYPVNKNLEANDISIERACEKVIKHFGLDKFRVVKIRNLSDNTDKEIKSTKNSYTEKFCQSIIWMDKVPLKIYESLLFDVNKDLDSISKLIAWYETQPYIQDYIKKDKFPISHENRILFDFYKRCIAERVKILNYQLYGIKERAISKSKYIPPWLTTINAFSMYKDKPYRYSRPFSIHYFDCRKIDLVGHRVDDLPISEVWEIQELYEKDRVKFYKGYFKRKPVSELFKSFDFYLLHLPLKKERKLIFDELFKLFKAKRWIGFYALALPQVEGLFSEMCSAISDADLSQNGLPSKVKSVRPFHYMSTSYFDYYEYHIPKQRNIFSHTGYDEDFKIKSYDLLTDLAHILKVFYELDNPLVKIKKLHVRKNHEDFITIREFVEYFRLLEGLKPKQKNEIESRIKNFEKEFLCQECNIEYLCYSMIQDMPKFIAEVIDSVNRNCEAHNVAMDLEKIRIPEIEQSLNDGKVLEAVSYGFGFKNEVVESLVDYSKFISVYEKYLPTLKQDIKKELKILKSTHGTVLKNIVFVNECINKKQDSNTDNEDMFWL